MSFSILQVLVTALVSAVVSAAVTALISWWRRPVVRWAIATRYGEEVASEPVPHVASVFVDDEIYFAFNIQNIGDANAYGVEISCGFKELLPLTAGALAGSVVFDTDQAGKYLFFTAQEIETADLVISYYVEPVWRGERVFRVPLRKLQNQQLVLSDVHLPWLVRWLQSSWPVRQG